jgi:hypothetical protein
MNRPEKFGETNFQRFTSTAQSLLRFRFLLAGREASANWLMFRELEAGGNSHN